MRVAAARVEVPELAGAGVAAWRFICRSRRAGLVEVAAFEPSDDVTTGTSDGEKDVADAPSSRVEEGARVSVAAASSMSSVLVTLIGTFPTTDSALLARRASIKVAEAFRASESYFQADEFTLLFRAVTAECAGIMYQRRSANRFTYPN